MGNAYVMVVLGILLAKCVGFFRDMIFAKVFGTGVMADIYFQVFGLVNLIFTGIGVALSTLVIKNINKSENLGQEKAYAASFLRKNFLFLCVAVVITALFAGQIVKVILPDITGVDYNLAVKLMYVMLPSLIFVVMAYIISGILQNEKVYFITSVMSLPYNAAIIFSLYMPNISIFAVSVVTTIGWLLHVAILLPAFYKKGYRITAKSPTNTNKNKSPEILWIFISNMTFQLCIYIDRAFVSGVSGMASSFNYASNLFITISSVFVVAMSTVVFPSISKNYEEGHIDYVNDLLRYIITVMVAIFVPYLLVVGLFGGDVIRLVYERGSFTSDSTTTVSTMFFIYSLGVLGYSCQELFNKILYLAGKYKYTVFGTLFVIVLNIITNLLINTFAPEFSVGALPGKALLIGLSTSFLLTIYAILIAIGIRKVVGPFWKKELIADILKTLFSAFLAFAVYLIFNTFMPNFTHGYISFMIPLLISGIVYIIALYLTGVLMKLIKREKKGID